MAVNENFEECLNIFINELKKTSIPNYYNPWKESKIRLENLKKFLSERKDTVRYVLIGEAPSYGARFTGIPMVSEKILKDYSEVFKNIKSTSISGNTEEKTAEIVWKKVIEKNSDGKQFATWNAFAFNNDETGSFVKNPSIKILTDEKNIKLLKRFLNLFPDAKIIAIGRKAQQAIGYAMSEYVRHPSSGGSKEFADYFSKLKI